MGEILKICLAVIMFGCLFDVTYGYYQLVRFKVLIGFAALAYQASHQGRQSEIFIYGAQALLFQLFLKIALGRELWNIVVVIKK